MTGAAAGGRSSSQWRDLVRHRGFRRLWLGDAVSLVGDWLTYVAVGALAIGAGEGLVAVALILVAHTLPRALLAPLAGRLADRRDRRAILVIASLARGAVVVAMAAAADAGWIGLCEGLLFLRMAVGAFVDPAASAALPQVLPRSALVAANAVIGATWSAVFAIGVALGGVVTATAGVVGALAIDAITFGIAAAIFAGLPRLRPANRRIGDEAGDDVTADPREPGDVPEAIDDRGRLADAWALARRSPAILEAALARAPVTMVSGGAWVLVHAIAAEAGAGAVALALGGLHSVRALGSGVGPLLWARVPALAGTRIGLHASVLLVLGAAAMLAIVDAPAALAGVVFLWGIAGGASWVTAATRMQALAPGGVIGRIAAIDLVGHTIGQCIGGLGGALVADALAAPRAAAWFGVVGGALAWLGLWWVACRPRRRERVTPTT